MSFEPAPVSQAASTSAPDAPPGLPALVAGLPGDDALAPQTLFGWAGQVRFLDHLSIYGSARGAARAAGVSHQTVYRMRRSNREFRRAWAAAMLLARPVAEAVIGDRAIDGIEEEVWFRGEVVGSRRRYDTRLLLAHIGRLDRLEENADAAALADDFDMVMDRVGSGQDLPPKPDIAEAVALLAETNTDGAKSADSRALEPCNMRSMSRAETPAMPQAEARAEVLAAHDCACPGAEHGTDGGRPHFRMTARGPEPVCNSGDGTAPCCDRPRWPDCKDCPHFPPVSRLHYQMEAQRPHDAPPLHLLGSDPAEVEAIQQEMFRDGIDDWWLIGEGYAVFEPDGMGGWDEVPVADDYDDDLDDDLAEDMHDDEGEDAPKDEELDAELDADLVAGRAELVAVLRRRSEET